MLSAGRGGVGGPGSVGGALVAAARGDGGAGDGDLRRGRCRRRRLAAACDTGGDECGCGAAVGGGWGFRPSRSRGAMRGAWVSTRWYILVARFFIV